VQGQRSRAILVQQQQPQQMRYVQHQREYARALVMHLTFSGNFRCSQRRRTTTLTAANHDEWTELVTCSQCACIYSAHLVSHSYAQPRGQLQAPQGQRMIVGAPQPPQHGGNSSDDVWTSVQKCAKFFKTLINLAQNNASGETVTMLVRVSTGHALSSTMRVCICSKLSVTK
jgi:hypothetical protein